MSKADILSEILSTPIVLPETKTGDEMLSWLMGYNACMIEVAKILKGGGDMDERITE